MAASVDGKVAAYPGELDDARRIYGFGGADDHAHMLAILKTADAVVVGRKSVVASGGAFAVTNERGAGVRWCVVTNQGMPAGHPFWTQHAVPRWLLSRAPLSGLDPAYGVENKIYGDNSPADAALTALQAAGAQTVVLFGGGELNREFYRRGLVDELILTICPVLYAQVAAVPLVAPELPKPLGMSLVTTQAKGDLVFLRYRLHQSL